MSFLAYTYRLVLTFPKKLVGILVLTSLLNMLCLISAAQTPNEYQVKAVFIYNFTQFVKWPSASFSNDTSPFIIGVYGRNNLDNYLEETVQNEKVGERNIEIRYLSTRQEAEQCHLVYIDKATFADVKDVLPTLANKAILTVSDAPEFNKLGGMIEMFKQDNRVRLQINIKAAQKANLDISSKLLKLATLFEK